MNKFLRLLIILVSLISFTGVTYAATPAYVGSGGESASQSAITPALPAGIQTDDILLLFVETANQTTSVTNANGGTWTAVASSPQGTGTAGGTAATRLTIFWSRYNGTQGNPTVGDSGDHQIGVILAFRGVYSTGDPWDVVTGGVEATADTSGSIPGTTTTVDETLVIAAIATALPDSNSTAVFSGWTNAGLTNLTEVTDRSRNFGNGGALGIAVGERLIAGAYGATTVTTSSATVKGMLSIALRPPPPPATLTSYTNTTESGLNYSGACTGCGARIGSGAFLQTVTITGANFGTDPGVGNRSTATNNIKVGAHQIPTANVTVWSATSITFTTNTVNDSDASWGVEFGGASALTVTAGGLTSTGLNFYVFPQVTSITSIVLDAAREYDAGDTDGVITLNGTRFGTAATGGYVRILGCDSVTCSSPTGTVTINSWSNTAIEAQVPTVIADNVYTGSIVIQQGVGSNTKTHTYTTTGFRILPRITGLAPSSGSISDAITVNGNHLCQAGAGSCPVTFSGTNKVTFTSAVDATVFTSWSNTAIATEVPASTITGNVVVTSNSYTSNGSLFTIISPTPSDPTSLNQYRDSGLTSAMSIGGTASSTPVYLTMTMEAPVGGGTLYPQIEYKDTATNFTCIGGGACGSAIEGPGFAGPGPVDCTVSNCKISITPTDNTYHWQARVRHNKSGVDYYSNWVSFGGNADPGATDFLVDTVAPVITLISSGTPGSNSATITWSTAGEISSTQVQYALGSPVTFGACSGDCTSIADVSPKVFSHSVSLSNLNSGSTYSFRVRSRDAAGNESVSTPNNTFATQSVSDPAKTTVFHIVGKTSGVTNASPLSQVFSVVMPENATTTKSIFVELEGVYVSTSGSPTVTVQVNGEASRVYTLPTIAATSHFKILHSITAITVDPGTNTLLVTPDANTTLNALSADVTVNYTYTP